jgi:hypothetical protein
MRASAATHRPSELRSNRRVEDRINGRGFDLALGGVLGRRDVHVEEPFECTQPLDCLLNGRNVAGDKARAHPSSASSRGSCEKWTSETTRGDRDQRRFATKLDDA